MLGSLDALLLDLDDTILDDAAGYQEAWDAAIAQMLAAHPALDREALAQEVGRQADWFWADDERHRWGRQDLARARGEFLTRALAAFGVHDEALARAAAETHTALRERRQRFLPGAREVLLELRERVPRLALVTNGGRAPQRAKIERFELGHLFDHIQVEGEFGLGKPEPAAYRNVLSALGVEPGRCLMVGDNYEADVVGPQRLGIRAVWIDKKRAGRPPKPPEQPHATIHHIRELL